MSNVPHIEAQVHPQVLQQTVQKPVGSVDQTTVTSDADNIFGLTAEPASSSFFQHIFPGVVAAKNLEAQHDLALTKSEKATMTVDEVETATSKTSWPIAPYNTAKYNYQTKFRSKWPEDVTEADRKIIDTISLTPDMTAKEIESRNNAIKKAGVKSLGHKLWTIWGKEWTLAGLGYLFKNISDFALLSQPIVVHGFDVTRTFRF